MKKTTAWRPLGMWPSLFPVGAFDTISLEDANTLLVKWGHRIGPLKRGKQRAWCHALFHNGRPVAVTMASYLIRQRVGGGLGHLTRENTVELSRLCAERPGLCRVALRLWREFVFPDLPFEAAISYQDADMHNGNTYRFDGWRRSPERADSGPDTRSGRPGRRKWVWVWPPEAVRPGVLVGVGVMEEEGVTPCEFPSPTE